MTRPIQAIFHPVRSVTSTGLSWFATALLVAAVGLFGIAQPQPVHAQNDFAQDLFPELSLGNIDSSEPDQWSADYSVDASGKGKLNVTVQLAAPWHIYSVTQKKGGPLKTTLAVESPPEVRVNSAFTPDKPPKAAPSPDYDGLIVEEHEQEVTWSAAINVPAGFNGPIMVTVDGLICKQGTCIPVSTTVEAAFQALTETPATQTPTTAPPVETDDTADQSNDSEPNVASRPAVGFRDQDSVVEWTAIATAREIAPGGLTELKITARPDDGFHIYRAAVDDSDSSTNFVVTEKSGLKVGAPETSSVVVSKLMEDGYPPIHYHDGAVTWSLPIRVPNETAAGTYRVVGMVAYIACTETSCMQPKAFQFELDLTVNPTASTSSPVAATLVSVSNADAMDAAATIAWVDSLAEPTVADVPQEPLQASMSLAGLLGLAFLGGIILNFMPCVLPVVGLKIMSFVKQAGADRGRIWTLNVVYTLGVLSVFGLLAGLAVVANFSWGEQFTYFPFKLGLTLLLFALALSYLGLWEIPAPGFASGEKSQELEQREGYLGAFSKGAFATVLATPCSGPLLGYIFGTTIGLDALDTVAVIMTVGLGMSMPYLIIGMKPELVSWLPKPGEWMETLKEFLAFLFLGTVAFFFAGFTEGQKLPVFVALIGVWFGCWIIGKTPNWEKPTKRLRAWAMGLTAGILIGVGAFHYLTPGESILPWEDYTEERLAELQKEGRTVMIDFTADWCVNCKVNYKVALDTKQTRDLLEELNAVPLLADWSDRSNTIVSKKLKELRSRSIPLLAIYPGSRPDQPIVLRDLVGQQTVLKALRAAGPSVEVETNATALDTVAEQEDASIASLRQ